MEGVNAPCEWKALALLVQGVHKEQLDKILTMCGSRVDQGIGIATVFLSTIFVLHEMSPDSKLWVLLVDLQWRSIVPGFFMLFSVSQ